MIVVLNKRKKTDNIYKEYGEDCLIIDVTSKAPDAFVRLSPFYPHGNIPIPNSKATSECVEGVWQGLKVFENEGVSLKSFKNKTGKNIKRTVRKLGVPKGHQLGIDSSELLGYLAARKRIFLPTYQYMLTNYCEDLIHKLRSLSENSTVILLDYTTNGDIYNLKTPLSHAQLVKAYCESKYDKLVDEE